MKKTNQAMQALAALKGRPPQTEIEIMRGLSLRRTSGGILVGRLHYSAHPERNPLIHPEWREQERRAYTSQAAWDREQEIIDEAGGGERVFADPLLTHFDKIVITSSTWRPNPGWKVVAGFDHGRASPTAMIRAYIDDEGVLYFCGEYYQPRLEIWQHVENLRTMADLDRVTDFYADPSIFPINVHANVPTRPGERAKSVFDIYSENGFGRLAPFYGDPSDVSFVHQLQMHWSNLPERAPSVRIVCRNYAETPQYGLHQWDCPNLMWELMRSRRVQSTAQQLLTRNASEAIVDKDNHARDAMKYILMSHPEPSQKSYRRRFDECMAEVVGVNPTQGITFTPRIVEAEQQVQVEEPVEYSGNIRHALREFERRNQRW